MVNTINAFCKSQKMPPTTCLSYIYLLDALSVDVAGLNPNCSSTEMLLTVICYRSLSYMIFSNTLQNEVNEEIGL
jgi:hypothetical protein